jgi:signal transduction histidine kinase
MRPADDDSFPSADLLSTAMSQNPEPNGERSEPGSVPPRGLGVSADLLADVASGVAEAVIGPARRPPSWLRMPGEWWQRILTLVAVFVLCWVLFAALVAQLEHLGVGSFLAGLVAAVQTLPLLALPVSPLLAWRWLVLGLLAGVLLTPRTAWPWPVTSMILLAVLLYLTANTHPRRTVIGVWVATTVVVLLGGAVLGGAQSAVVVVLSGLAALLLLLGDTVRDRRAVRRRLDRATQQRRQDLARQAVLEERSHIARELHDVVAHHMSMIAVQAEAAPLRYPDLSPEVARTFTVIRDASREALTEMRRVIGALRDEEQPPDHAPQPGAAQVGQLVEASQQAGMDVVLTVAGEERALPAAVDLSVYRLVQEGLSNARRHAPGAAVHVELAYLEDRVRVRVADDGGRAVSQGG